ncbi:methyltransferase-like protein 24 [Lingula anatina]|uniref:Methyltransferase-like protein 24 n=1 Tax=Lingula anatina TaxID=7574 RepID=A0A1S3I1Z8_LINAN|nr:methyltransferase-like protein 24 [Lingula anatina]|eukprot:XP_013392292.1 methyltransferase-like protein 24 [Lingula anatina]
MFRKTGLLVALVGLLGFSLVFQHKKIWKMVQYPAKPVGSRYIYSELFPMLEKMDYSPKAMPATVSNTTTKEAATYDAMERDFTRYLLRAQFDCRHRVRAGRKEYQDGGWEVCLDPPFNMVRGECLVYSFGINNEWSFDDYMDTKFGCQVHSFDPSMVEKTDFSRSKNIRFHPIGIAGTNGFVERKLKRGKRENWRMATLGTILQLYGHENKILDYLKMDVEASEWDSSFSCLS